MYSVQVSFDTQNGSGWSRAVHVGRYDRVKDCPVCSHPKRAEIDEQMAAYARAGYEAPSEVVRRFVDGPEELPSFTLFELMEHWRKHVHADPDEKFG